MSYIQRYNIPEYVNPYSGIITLEDGHFYYGNYSEGNGFNFPQKKRSPHRHQYYEIFWLPNPSGNFISDFRTFSITEPCLLFVSPGQVHGWPDGYGVKGWMLAFDDAFFGNQHSILLRSPLFFDSASTPIVPVSDTNKMSLIWNQIGREFDEKQPDHVDALRSLLHLLVIEAHRLQIESGNGLEKPHSTKARLYQAFIKTLSGDIPENHLPKHYAEQLGVTADYLSECVRIHSGHNAGKLIRRRIVLECKRLLAHSDMTISEIAYHLHFKDPSYFSRFFKRNTELSPKEFRELIKDNS